MVNNSLIPWFILLHSGWTFYVPTKTTCLDKSDILTMTVKLCWLYILKIIIFVYINTNTIKFKKYQTGILFDNWDRNPAEFTHMKISPTNSLTFHSKIKTSKQFWFYKNLTKSRCIVGIISGGGFFSIISHWNLYQTTESQIKFLSTFRLVRMM